ncbi:MAG: DUF664 domain-containing protein [Actinomadura sp.]
MSDVTPDRPARSFAWSNMFVRPADDPRTDGGFTGERDTLVGYLRDQRLTLELKCSGLDAGAMARRSVEPSNLSLLGLVRHLADVERGWFRRVLAGQDAAPRYHTDTDFDGAVPDPGVVTRAWDVWRAEVAFAEEFVAGAPDLDITGSNGGWTVERNPFEDTTWTSVLGHRHHVPATPITRPWQLSVLEEILFKTVRKRM